MYIFQFYMENLTFEGHILKIKWGFYFEMMEKQKKINNFSLVFTFTVNDTLQMVGINAW